MTDAEQLEAAGLALFGTQWQRDIARAIGANDRTVRRWAAGDYNVPAEAWKKIAELAVERRLAISATLPALRRRARS